MALLNHSQDNSGRPAAAAHAGQTGIRVSQKLAESARADPAAVLEQLGTSPDGLPRPRSHLAWRSTGETRSPGRSAPPFSPACGTMSRIHW